MTTDDTPPTSDAAPVEVLPAPPPNVGHRFAKGHPFYPPKDKLVSAAPLGRDVHTRKRMRSLALVIHERWPAEQIFHWLREVAAGRDPDAKPDKNGGLTQVPIDWTIRIRAAKMLLERMLGQPAQHVHMEAELRAAVVTVAATTERGQWRDLPPDKLASLRDGLRTLLGPQPATSGGPATPSYAVPVVPPPEPADE